MGIEEIRAALEKATAAPWHAVDTPGQGPEVHWRLPQPGQLDAPVCHMRWTDGMHPEVEARVMADARLIALLRNEAPALLARIDALEALVPDLVAACEELLSEIADQACVSVDEYTTETGHGERAAAAIAKAREALP